ANKYVAIGERQGGTLVVMLRTKAHDPAYIIAGRACHAAVNNYRRYSVCSRGQIQRVEPLNESCCGARRFFRTRDQVNNPRRRIDHWRAHNAHRATVIAITTPAGPSHIGVAWSHRRRRSENAVEVRLP